VRGFLLFSHLPYERGKRRIRLVPEWALKKAVCLGQAGKARPSAEIRPESGALLNP